MRRAGALLAALPIVLLLLPGATAARAATGDWPQYLHDAQRTSANPDETALSAANAAKLTPLWSVATGGPIAAGATVVGGTAYFGSWDGNEYAIDAATGAVRWKTFLGVTKAPSCFPPAAGVTSTAAVLNGVVYVGGGDSSWYALDASTGAVLWSVFTGDNSATGGHYNWSSPLLFNGFAYIGVASFGDCPLVPGQLLKVNLSTHQVVATFNAVAAGQVGGGIWTSPSLDVATNTIFVDTGSPGASGQPTSQAIVSVDATTLALRSSWKVPAADLVADSDWSTSPILFTDAGGRGLVAAMNKNGNLYAFDRGNLSAGPVWQKLVANGGDCPTCGDSSVASAAFANGQLYVAGGNTTIGGAGAIGSVRALDPANGAYLWEHPDPQPVIAAVAYANGLVYDGTGPTLEVLSAATGKRLYSATTGATIYGPPTVANGRVYAGSVDGRLYAWAQPASPPPAPPADPNCPSGWTCQDVGAPAPAGSESVAGGTWTVSAGGAGVGATADQFRLLSKAVTGGVQATATVAAQQPAGAEEGVMVRQSADPASPFYALLLTPLGLVAEYRAAPGGPVAQAVTVAGAPPARLEVQRVGDVFVAATSSDGVTYTLVPGSTVTLVLPADVLAGVAADSGAPGTAASVTLTGVAAGAAGAAPGPAPSASPCPSGWACADVGNPAVVGNQGLSGGTWSVQGAGGDIWDTGDQFHFVWQPLAADGTISARVATQGDTDPWAKAGVMLRQSAADPASVYYGVFVTPANGVVVQVRSSEGLRTVQAATAAGAAPAFLRVARSGSAFTAYTSSDGAAWTPMPGSSVTIPGLGGMLAGLAVTAHNGGALSTATFDAVAVGTTAPPPPFACPSGWTCADIGGATPAGSQSLDSGTWTVQGGGVDIWGTGDQFRYIWQSLAGDGTASARVASQTDTDGWAKAGVMLRQTSDPGSPYYALEVTPGNGLVVQYRATAGGAAAMAASVAGSAPAYVRVGRAGSTFTAYTSADGASWTPIAGSAVTLSVSGTLLAGLAVTSHNAGTVSTVTFGAVAIGAAGPPPGVCPTSWTCADIGGATPAGTQTLNGSTWTVQGGGADIWGTGDQFRFESQPVAGDGTVTARVVAQGNTNVWAKAGVMLRQTSDPGSVYYALELTPGNGLQVQYRPSAGGNAVTAASLAGAAPAYVRVARSGGTFTAYTSSDGVSWMPVAGSSVTLAVSGGMLGGLAVTSHDSQALSTVTFDAVALSNSAPPPPFACPSGWTCADIGGPTPAGVQTLNGSTWTVQGGGADIWGTADQFRLVSQSLAGDGTVSARVTAQTNTDPWAKGGVMLRQSTAAGSIYYAIEVTPGNGLVVQYRGSTGGSAVMPAGVAGAVPAYVRVGRAGTTFTAYTSADGVTWTPVAGSSVTLPVGGAMLAGMAVTSHNNSALSAVTYTAVSVAAG